MNKWRLHFLRVVFYIIFPIGSSLVAIWLVRGEKYLLLLFPYFILYLIVFRRIAQWVEKLDKS